MSRFTTPVWFVLLAIFAFRAPLPQAIGILDPDFYWHLEYGLQMLAALTLPTVDTWSWTMNGAPYRLTQWAGEVAIGMAHHLGGELGTGALAAALATTTIALGYRSARIFLDAKWMALSLSILCNALLLQLPSRPHQWTHLGLAALNLVLLEFAHRGRRTWLFCLPVLFACWVNLHGGYAFGLAYFGLFAATATLDAIRSNGHTAWRTVALPLGMTWLASLAATLLNPYGVGAWEYAVAIAQLQTSTAGVIAEWLPPTIQSETGFQLFILSIAAFAAMATSKDRPTAGHLLRTIALVALGWTAVRISVMVLVLIVPFIAASLASTPAYLKLAATSRHYDAPRSFPMAISIVCLAGALGFFLGKVDTTVAKRNQHYYPVAEATFLKDKQLSSLRILNTPESGGYLIRVHQMKVAIDTRLDLYGDKAYFAYIFANRGQTGWRDYLDSLKPDVLLLNQQSALRELTVATGLYRPVFEGPAHTVLLKTGVRDDVAAIPLANVSAAALNRMH